MILEGSFFPVCEGMFALFFPWDAHLTGLPAGQGGVATKALVKVRV